MDERKKRIIFWLIITILSFLALYLLMKLSPMYHGVFSIGLKILTPFLISAFIAYLLHPIVEKLHSRKIPRWLAILSIYLLFFGGIGYGIYRAYPILVSQLKDLAQNIPTFVEQYRNWIYDLYVKTSSLPESFHDKMDEFFLSIEKYGENLLTGIASKMANIMDMIIIVGVIPVLVFYMLKDFSLMENFFWKFIPKKHRGNGQQLVKEIDQSLGNYIRGQLLVCLFVGVISYGILWFIGMKYPLLLGLVMGITNIIPYFGPIIGAVPAVIIAFTMSVEMVVYVVIAVIVVQIIESNLLSPFIYGKSLHIHPVLIIFALLIGGEVGGIIGMIIAVPILTIAKVFLHHTRLNL